MKNRYSKSIRGKKKKKKEKGSIKGKMAHFKIILCRQVNQRLRSNQNSLNFTYVLVLINLLKVFRDGRREAVNWLSKRGQMQTTRSLSMLLLFGPACIWVLSSTVLLTAPIRNQWQFFQGHLHGGKKKNELCSMLAVSPFRLKWYWY